MQLFLLSPGWNTCRYWPSCGTSNSGGWWLLGLALKDCAIVLQPCLAILKRTTCLTHSFPAFDLPASGRVPEAKVVSRSSEMIAEVVDRMFSVNLLVLLPLLSHCPLPGVVGSRVAALQDGVHSPSHSQGKQGICLFFLWKLSNPGLGEVETVWLCFGSIVFCFFLKRKSFFQQPSAGD